jgi:hypothetical protein
MKRASWTWLLLLCVGACESPTAKFAEHVDELEKRASFDLNCPREQIEWTTLGKRTRGATGCGRQASYAWVCAREGDMYDDACQWILNSAAQR